MHQECIFINREINSIVCLNFQISVFLFDVLEFIDYFRYFHKLLFYEPHLSPTALGCYSTISQSSEKMSDIDGTHESARPVLLL